MPKQNNPTPDTSIVPHEIINGVFGDYLQGERYLEADLAAYSKVEASISRMKTVHDNVRIGFKSVLDALRNPDPLETKEKNYFDIERRFNKFIDDAAKHGDEATQSVKSKIAKIDDEIAVYLDIKEGEYSKEIRSHFLKLEQGERLSAAYAAIDAFDKNTMSALLLGPAYLSGLDDAQQAGLRKRYTEVQAADHLARRRVFEKAIAVNRRTFDELLAAGTRLFPAERLAGITARSQTANKHRDNIGRWAA